MMALIGERVQKYRRQKGWSQEQLGAMVGFSQSKISKIENGDWDSLSDLKKGTKYVFRVRCQKTNKDRGRTWSEYSPWGSVTVK